MKKILRVLVLALVVSGFTLTGLSVFGAPPERDISARRHPNLAAAQKLVDQAWRKIVIAQKKNEFDMDGHAQKAKELLDQVNSELKQAAEAANAHNHR